MSHVLTKSAKGLREASGKTHELSEELRNVLVLCKGQFLAEDLVAQVPEAEQESVARSLIALLEAGFLREVWELDEQSISLDIDNGAAKGEVPATGERRVRSDGVAPGGVERRRSEVADHLRSGMAVRRGQRDEATSAQIRQAEEAARRRAEEKARQEAEKKAKKEAEERAIREAAERARREAEEKAYLEQLERERIEAEERARAEAVERTRRAAEEKARKVAAEKARREAEEQERLAAEEREREEMRERIRQRKLGRTKMLAPMFVMVVGLPLLAVSALEYVPMDGMRRHFEEAGTKALHAPVKVGEARLSLLPTPQWHLDDIVVGTEGNAAKIEHATVGVSWRSLLKSSDELSSMRLDGVRVPLAGAIAGMIDPDARLSVTASEITMTKLTLASDAEILPPLDLSLNLHDGQIAGFQAVGKDDDFGKVTVDGSRLATAWQLNVTAARYVVPFGAQVPLTDFSCKAQLLSDRMIVSKYAGRSHAGDVSGSATIDWKGPWVLRGNVEAQRVSAALLAPAWATDGVVSGNAEIAAEAPTADALFEKAHVAGQFAVGTGTLAGVDLDRIVQGRSGGEQSRFEQIAGTVTADAKRFELSGIRLSAGALTATGNITIDPAGAVNGRMAIEVKAGASRLSNSFAIAGSISDPRFQQ